jgi:cell division protein FtsB
MAFYGNFNRRRKGKKIITAVICTAIILLAVIFYIGLTVGNDGDEMQRISSAVAENTQLKEQISSLTQQVEQLQEEVTNLNEQLEAQAAATPLPSALPSTTAPEATPSKISPRGEN